MSGFGVRVKEQELYLGLTISHHFDAQLSYTKKSIINEAEITVSPPNVGSTDHNASHPQDIYTALLNS